MSIDDKLPTLSAPPRRVGLPLTLTTLFGGYPQVLGWTFLLIGLTTLCLAEPAFQTRDNLLLLLDDTRVIRGELLEQEATGWGRGGGSTISRNPAAPILRYTFRFTVESREFTSDSYGEGELSADQPLDIEYAVSRPESARIVGKRAGLFPAGTLTMFLVAGVLGAFILACSLPWRLQRLALLRRGVPTFARLLSQEETNVAVMGKSIRKLTLEYRPADAGTPLTTTIKSTLEFADEARIRILYQKGKPSNVVLMDDLPESVEVRPEGYFSSQKVGQALSFASLPFSALVIFSIWLARVITGA